MRPWGTVQPRPSPAASRRPHARIRAGQLLRHSRVPGHRLCCSQRLRPTPARQSLPPCWPCERMCTQTRTCTCRHPPTDMHTQKHNHRHADTYTCTDRHTHMHIDTHAHRHRHEDMHKHAEMQTHTYRLAHVNRPAHGHAYMHVHTDIRHTHISSQRHVHVRTQTCAHGLCSAPVS